MTDDRLTRIEARIERTEAVLVMLVEELVAFNGILLLTPFARFLDDWQREHAGQHGPDT